MPFLKRMKEKKFIALTIILIVSAVSISTLFYFLTPGTSGNDAINQNQCPRVLRIDDAKNFNPWEPLYVWAGVNYIIVEPLGPHTAAFAFVDLNRGDLDIALMFNIPRDDLKCVNGTHRIIWGLNAGGRAYFLVFNIASGKWFTTEYGIDSEYKDAILQSLLVDQRFL